MSARKTVRARFFTGLVTGGVLLAGLDLRHDPGTGLAVPVTFGTVAMARDVAFKSTQAAFDQGIGAYKGGFYDRAIPAFEFVISRNDPDNRLFAEFYLARIFADATGGHTDHTRAYMLYQRIADEHADTDPDHPRKAPIAAKALTAVALYVRDGLPAIGLTPDAERAIEYLRHAATFFNEPDAQFELAKLLLRDSSQRATGLHFLQKLVRENHAGAQATFAEMLARGRYVKQDQAQALGLIRLAVENAAPSDRIWIDDIYQQLFCGSSAEAREKSNGLVAAWRKLFTQPRSTVEQPMALGRRPDGTPTRVCSNGERLEIPQNGPLSPMVATSPTPPPLAHGLVPSGVRDAAGSPAFGLMPATPSASPRPGSR